MAKIKFQSMNLKLIILHQYFKIFIRITLELKLKRKLKMKYFKSLYIQFLKKGISKLK
jgi:hypothetical protein